MSDETTQDWFFTFCNGTPLRNHYIVLHGTYAEARDKMHNYFGSKWAFQYPSAEAAGVQRFNLIRLEE